MLRDRQDITEFLSGDPAVVLVRIAEAKGSTPREAGTWMLVSEAGIFRTIGGGQLEYLAIDHARALLRKNLASETLSVPLGPDIGQCCGGRVRLRLERLTETRRQDLFAEIDAEIDALREVYVFGAGHVGRALSACLSLLPVRAVLVDTRPEELATAPDRVETCLTAIPEAMVRDAAAGSAFVILTHDHALDFLIAREALERGDAAYVGLIGSRTKRATFRRWFEKETRRPDAIEALVCPIGQLGAGDKRPEVIAGFVATEIMLAFAQPRSVSGKRNGKSGARSALAGRSTGSLNSLATPSR